MKTTESNHAPHGQSKESEAVFVSEPIGKGADAHRIVRVGAWEFTAPGTSGSDLLMPDTLLAERLGLPIHKLRQLSGRHETAGNIAPMVSTTVVGTSGRPGTRRLYNEADALFLVTRSETPKAVALTREMIAVYMLARRGLIAPAIDGPAMAAMVRSMMAETGAILRAEILTEIRSAQPANLNGDAVPFLDRRARSMVLNPIMVVARTYAGPGADRRRVMQERGRFDKKLRDALNWQRRWCFYPSHEFGRVASLLESELAIANRFATELIRAKQLSLVPTPKPPSRGDA